MFRRSARLTRAVALTAIMGLAVGCAPGRAVTLPDPVVDTPLAKAKGTQTVIFAGGCFWGVQAVFKRVKGVTSATSGYSGGTAASAKYDLVSMGNTDHAEAVRVVYDPSLVSFGQLLKVFFAVAHDPTELNRQGPDVGRQYRSAIFFTSADQQKVAKAYVAQLDKAKAYYAPIVTELTAFKAFYRAEDYHQDYLERHPNDPYIVINDLPKIEALQKELPRLYVKR